MKTNPGTPDLTGSAPRPAASDPSGHLPREVQEIPSHPQQGDKWGDTDAPSALWELLRPDGLHRLPLIRRDEFGATLRPLQEQSPVTHQALLDRCTSELAACLERDVIARATAIAAWAGNADAVVAECHELSVCDKPMGRIPFQYRNIVGGGRHRQTGWIRSNDVPWPIIHGELLDPTAGSADGEGEACSEETADGGMDMIRSLKSRAMVAVAGALATTGVLAPSAAAHGTCADHSTQVRSGEFGWSSSHDRDNDGVGCESNPGRSSSLAPRRSDTATAGDGGSVDPRLGLLLLGGVGYGGYRIGQKRRAN